MKKIEDSIKDDHAKLIFLVCGKRCYNTLMKTKKNNSKDGVSDYTVAQSWDKDGNVNTNTMSSIDILIDWLTTEENASKYFGGVDMDGNTNATRKEAYHHHIRDLIKKENGRLILLKCVLYLLIYFLLLTLYDFFHSLYTFIYQLGSDQ